MQIVKPFKSIFRKGIRTWLTISGIAVGVMSVIIIFAMSESGTKAVSAELDSLGLNGISVSSENDSVKLQYSDSDIIRQIKGVENVTPVLTLKTDIKSDTAEHSAMLWGIDNDKQVFKFDIISGRAISKSEISQSQKVCLLDKKAAKSLFNTQNACGKEIYFTIGTMTVKCKVIGITSADSSILKSVSGTILPDFVYLPYTLMCDIQGKNIDSIAVSVSANSNSIAVNNEILSSLNKIKGTKDAFKLTDLSSQRDKLNSLLSTVTAILSAIGIIALIVAGLSIMTVMLMSVNERTREIGIKKAIGAGFYDIFKEFLFESVVISLIGAFFGALLGIFAVTIGSKLCGTAVTLSTSSLIISILCAVFFGALFGVYPAIKAAKMKPVDAFRHE